MKNDIIDAQSIDILYPEQFDEKGIQEAERNAHSKLIDCDKSDLQAKANANKVAAQHYLGIGHIWKSMLAMVI